MFFKQILFFCCLVPVLYVSLLHRVIMKKNIFCIFFLHALTLSINSGRFNFFACCKEKSLEVTEPVSNFENPIYRLSNSNILNRDDLKDDSDSMILDNEIELENDALSKSFSSQGTQNFEYKIRIDKIDCLFSTFNFDNINKKNFIFYLQRYIDIFSKIKVKKSWNEKKKVLYDWLKEYEVFWFYKDKVTLHKACLSSYDNLNTHSITHIVFSEKIHFDIYKSKGIKTVVQNLRDQDSCSFEKEEAKTDQQVVFELFNLLNKLYYQDVLEGHFLALEVNFLSYDFFLEIFKNKKRECPIFLNDKNIDAQKNSLDVKIAVAVDIINEIENLLIRFD